MNGFCAAHLWDSGAFIHLRYSIKLPSSDERLVGWRSETLQLSEYEEGGPHGTGRDDALQLSAHCRKLE